MQRYYKPSGKVSPLLIIYAALTFLLLIPIVSVVYAMVLAYYSSSAESDFVSTVASIVVIAYLSAFFCVARSKVRNYLVAFVVALLSTLLFCVLSLTFFYMFSRGAGTIEAFLSLLQPSNFFLAMQSITSEGYTVSFPSTVTLFTIPAGAFFFTLILVAFITLALISIACMTRTGKPFDEANKRWAKKTEMNTTFIEDPTRFMESLRYNDFSVLDKLQVLHTVNTDYAKFKIFPAAEGFCISIENFRKTRTKNNGVTKYDGEKLCQYLMISKDAGSKLLSRSMLDNDSKATARIVGKRARWKEKLRIILIFFATGIFLFCGYMALVAGENAGEMLRHPIAVVVSAAFVLIFLLSLVGSYLKEDVILLEDNELDASWMPPDATTGKHHVKKRDRGLGYKIYFTLMSIISIVIFIFTVIS